MKKGPSPKQSLLNAFQKQNPKFGIANQRPNFKNQARTKNFTRKVPNA